MKTAVFRLFERRLDDFERFEQIFDKLFEMKAFGTPA